MPSKSKAEGPRKERSGKTNRKNSPQRAKRGNETASCSSGDVAGGRSHGSLKKLHEEWAQSQKSGGDDVHREPDAHPAEALDGKDSDVPEQSQATVATDTGDTLDSPAAAALAAKEKTAPPRVEYDADSAIATWNGEEYEFSETQALFVDQYYDWWEQRKFKPRFMVFEKKLLGAVKEKHPHVQTKRLCDLFKHHLAWGTWMMHKKKRIWFR